MAENRTIPEFRGTTMRRIIPAGLLALLMVAMAAPANAGYLVIRVILEGGASGSGGDTTGSGGDVIIKMPMAPGPMGTGVPPDGYKTGFGGPMGMGGGGSPTTKSGRTDPTN